MDIFKYKYVPCHILAVLVLGHYSLFIWNSTWPEWLIFYLAAVLQEKAESAVVLGSEGWVVHGPREQSHDRLHLWPILDSSLGLLYCLTMFVLQKKKTTKQSKKQYQFLGQLVHLLKLRWYLRKKLGLYRTWVQIPAWRLAHRETSHKPLSFSEPQNLISEMKTRIPAYLSCWEDCDNVCKLPSAKGKV